ncbi:Transposon Tn7 transposition protein tnsD [Shigella sonnei]|nr:Transposon Tn7 transposition protein tnsD [Shigella sonnei]CSE57254.1 Transposon Tn7 transposition protein tnsD [Shigella sonnei]CSE60742.1 Transposon Tn7 transposition protein tnsD [Shigella sonnei]CSF62388.1 Transposon Tn7 transposition protein tnsD [Shigella sonnei]CSS18877.1 Transposon Tn7 transposition protein tnsD [Shigella sonnei]
MRNFPVPYSNELIYSTIARAGVYQGIVSPKQLLDEVYGNRKVVATLGLPSHLGVIARHLHQTGRYAVLKWSTKTGHRVRVFPVSIFRFVWG